MAYVITNACVGVKDTACVDVCPCDCIAPRKGDAGFAEAAQLYIDPVHCIDCGACLPACPVSAIYFDADLPPGLEHFAKVNADWYAVAK